MRILNDDKMIKIIHRVNTLEALEKVPVASDYGVEVDIRSRDKKLIMSHEPFKNGQDFEQLCSRLKGRFIVLNPKEDGLEHEIDSLLKKYSIKNYFYLDLPFPTIAKIVKAGNRKIAIRFSEYEPIEACVAMAGMVEWIWVDTFTKLPLNKENYDMLKDKGFRLCLVDPERWGRKNDSAIYAKRLRKNGIKLDGVMTTTELAELWD